MASRLRVPQAQLRASDTDDLYQRTAVLHLRPPPTEEEIARANRGRLRVTWEDNIDEHPNQRVSKSCCVFHKKKLFGESSSDEDSSSSDSDSDDCGASVQRDVHSGAHVECAHTHEDTSGGHHHHHRPKCTKEHCYCGTRFH